MKELEHKRSVETLWKEKLEMYKAQRRMEEEERRLADQEEIRKKSIIE